MVGDACEDSIGRPTCGDGAWCLQVMGVNGGAGVCSSFCDPASAVSGEGAAACPSGYSCTAVGVALVASAPTIHVCQVTGSDAGLPSVGFDAGSPESPDATADVAVPLDGNLHLLFDGQLP